MISCFIAISLVSVGTSIDNNAYSVKLCYRISDSFYIDEACLSKTYTKAQTYYFEENGRVIKTMLPIRRFSRNDIYYDSTNKTPFDTIKKIFTNFAINAVVEFYYGTFFLQ